MSDFNNEIKAKMEDLGIGHHKSYIDGKIK